MALSMRRLNVKQANAASAVKRTRVVRVNAVQRNSNPTAAIAAAAAAVLLVASPAFAAFESAPMVNPQSEIAVGPKTKGSLAPDEAGQMSAGRPRKAAEVRKQRGVFVAANKEHQQDAAIKYPTSKVNWRRGFNN